MSSAETPNFTNSFRKAVTLTDPTVSWVPPYSSTAQRRDMSRLGRACMPYGRDAGRRIPDVVPRRRKTRREAGANGMTVPAGRITSTV